MSIMTSSLFNLFVTAFSLGPKTLLPLYSTRIVVSVSTNKRSANVISYLPLALGVKALTV